MKKEKVDITETIGCGNVSVIMQILKLYYEKGFDCLYWDGYDSTIYLYKSLETTEAFEDIIKIEEKKD